MKLTKLVMLFLVISLLGCGKGDSPTELDVDRNILLYSDRVVIFDQANPNHHAGNAETQGFSDIDLGGC
jgi:hypothetical protein